MKEQSRQTRIANRGEGFVAAIAAILILWYMLLITAAFLGVVWLARQVF